MVAEAKTVTYYVKLTAKKAVSRGPDDGARVVGLVVPDTYKVTFGPLVPGSKGGASEMVFRVYDSSGKKCRILLRDAITFWSDDVTLVDVNGNVLDSMAVMANGE